MCTFNIFAGICVNTGFIQKSAGKCSKPDLSVGCNVSAHFLTLDTLGEVPEIEDIVGLSWSGQQINT